MTTAIAIALLILCPVLGVTRIHSERKAGGKK